MIAPSRTVPFALTALLLTASVDLAAQTPQRLSTGSGPGLRYPVVALDADAVAWVAMSGGSRELFVADTAGSAPIQLTTGMEVRAGHGMFDPWSPISISDDGNLLCYWNAQGVRVLDRQNNTDVVVAAATLLPMPRLDGDGSRLVYQEPVNGDLEVFVVDSAGVNPPLQLTQSSGPGRRLPHIRGDLVLFQKLVNDQMELFVHDLGTSTTGPALTSGSGGGNRHGRLTPDGDAVVYEAVVSGLQTAMRLDLATSTSTTIAAGTSGARLPAGDGDDQIVLQDTITAPEVVLADPALTSVTAGSRGGHRMPAIDRHGQLLAWQQEDQGQLEVFALRRCWPATVGSYGTAGQPSVGTLQSFDVMWRCEQRFGVDTQLPAGTPAVYALGLQQQSLPLPGAPGNFLRVVTLGTVFLLADAQGDVTASFPLSPNLYGVTIHAQFALLDPGANALGVVTSAGFDLFIQ